MNAEEVNAKTIEQENNRETENKHVSFLKISLYLSVYVMCYMCVFQFERENGIYIVNVSMGQQQKGLCIHSNRSCRNANDPVRIGCGGEYDTNLLWNKR